MLEGSAWGHIYDMRILGFNIIYSITKAKC